MEGAAQQFSVLIVSAVPLVGARLAEQLPRGRCSSVCTAKNAREAESFLETTDVAILFSPDEALVQMGCRLAEDCRKGVLLIVGDGAYERVSAEAAEHGVCVATVSVSEGALRQAISNLMTMCGRLSRAEREATELRSRLDDVRVLQRAKLLLMLHLGMEEQEAHRYLSKTAMDTCRKLRDVALSIIRTYEN